MATYVVTTLEDENDSNASVDDSGGTGLSLREALTLANGNAGADTITFASDLAGGTISLNSSLFVEGEVAINGNIAGGSAPDITLDAQQGFSILQLQVYSSMPVSVDGITFKNGNGGSGVGGGAISGNFYSSFVTISNCSFDNNDAFSGGAIRAGRVTVTSSIFTGNDATASNGGAIYADSYATVTGSTFENNSAVLPGGAVYAYDDVNVSNSTFIQNSTANNYGAAAYSAGTMTVTDSTMVGNSGKNIVRGLSGLTVSNSIIVDNASPNQWPVNSNGGVTYQGHNIISDGSNYYLDDQLLVGVSLADILVTSNGAAVLADNGGPVKTIALNPALTNPALDAGGLATDARGLDSLDLTGLGNDGSDFGDLGAFEYATRIISVDSGSSDGVYWLGQTIDITIRFDRRVDVTGIPTLLLETGTTDRAASYVGGTGTDTLTFRYTVQAGDTATDLNFASTSALVLNGGAISGPLSDGSLLGLPSLAGSNSLASQAAIEVRGVGAPAAPVVANQIADQSATEDAAFSFTVPADTFSDVNGDALTYSAALADGSALPSWLTFNATTRTFSGTPLNAHVGEIAVRVTASDGTSTTSDEFVLTIANTNDAPTAVELSSNTVAENSAAGTVIGDLSAIDPDADDTATFSLLSSAGNRFALVGSHLVVADGAALDFEARKSYAVTVRATDAAGETFDQTLTIALTDIDDTVVGTKGNNVLKGGDGNERLDGRSGNDRLTGGDGADTFVFGKGYGRDVITDFDPAEGDVIDLSGAVGIKNFKDLIRHHVEDTGKDLVITADDGSVLVLKGIDIDDLTRDSFLF